MCSYKHTHNGAVHIGNDGTHYNVYFKDYYLGTIVVLPNRVDEVGETILPQEIIRKKQDEIKDFIKKAPNKNPFNLTNADQIKLRNNLISLYKGMRITIVESAADTDPFPNQTINFDKLLDSYFGKFFKSNLQYILEMD